MSSLPILLAVDPSVNNLGWACCNLSRASLHPDIYDIELWDSGVIHPQGIEIHHKWQDAYEQLAAKVRDSWPTHLVVEWPMFFGSARGRIAAAQGGTINLAGMAAGIIAWFRLPASNVSLLTPVQWKGSVPKDVVRQRLEQAFAGNSCNLSDDEVDAIALAEFWLKNHLRRRNGPPLEERHSDQKADLVRLVQEAREKCNGSDASWWGRISTILRRRGDIPRNLAREVLRQDFKIRPKQIQTIMRNAP
jgi:Holliday junction resolvasome RuvABC endonuclease subunit